MSARRLQTTGGFYSPARGSPGAHPRGRSWWSGRGDDYQAVAYLEITCGEYQARCDCYTTFRSTPDGVLPGAAYDNTVRDLVLGQIIEDGMSIERTPQSLRREFLLELSIGFVYDVLSDRGWADGITLSPSAMRQAASARATAPSCGMRT